MIRESVGSNSSCVKPRFWDVAPYDVDEHDREGDYGDDGDDK